MNLHEMNKKTWISLAVLFFIAVVCIPGTWYFFNRSSLVSDTTKKTGSEKKETLTLWCYWEEEHDRTVLQNLADEYSKSQDQYKISISYYPQEDFKKRMALSMANDAMPDMSLVDSSDFQYLNHMKSFVDLTDRVEGIGEYLPIALQSCKVDYRYYGLPFTMNCTALFYNEKILEELKLKVPTTWDELIAEAKIMNAHNYQGLLVSNYQSEVASYTFLPVLWSTGGDLFDLKSDGSRQAFEVYQKMVKAGIITRQSLNVSSSDENSIFAEGNVGFMFGGTGDIDEIRMESPGLKFGVDFYPRETKKVTVAGGEVFAVTEGEHAAACVDFLNYLTSDKERLKTYIEELGALAPIQSVMDEQYTDDAVQRKTIELFQAAKTRTLDKDWPELSNVLVGAIRSVVVGDEKLDDILDDAATNIDAIEKETR